jgi:hypothetical protein
MRSAIQHALKEASKIPPTPIPSTKKKFNGKKQQLELVVLFMKEEVIEDDKKEVVEERKESTTTETASSKKPPNTRRSTIPSVEKEEELVNGNSRITKTFQNVIVAIIMLGFTNGIHGAAFTNPPKDIKTSTETNEPIVFPEPKMSFAHMTSFQQQFENAELPVELKKVSEKNPSGFYMLSHHPNESDSVGKQFDEFRSVFQEQARSALAFWEKHKDDIETGFVETSRPSVHEISITTLELEQDVFISTYMAINKFHKLVDGFRLKRKSGDSFTNISHSSSSSVVSTTSSNEAPTKTARVLTGKSLEDF